MTPLWGAIFSAALLGDPLTRRKLLGLALGVSGVALIALRGTGFGTVPDPLGIAACVLATVCYGFSGSYIKRWAKDVPSRQMTAASLSLAGLAFLPFAVLTLPAAGGIPATVWLIAVGFALLCSAFAYLVYFRLIAGAALVVLGTALVIRRVKGKR